MDTTLTNSKPGRILVIDDNEAIHHDYLKILTTEKSAADANFDSMQAALFGDEENKIKRANYSVECAFQGKIGLDLLVQAIDRNDPFDLAFVDMRMPPGWDGVETIEALWKADNDLQVVICTAFSDYSWEETLTRLGMSDRLLILKKPFDNAEVLQMAMSLFEKRKLLRQLRKQTGKLESQVAEQTAELKVAYEDAERLLEAISSILISLDAKGNIIRWNQMAESVFGISAAAVQGKRFVELEIDWRHPAVAKQYLTQWDFATRNRQELEFTNKEGAIRSLGMSAFPVESSQGNAGCLFLGSDITETKLLRNQLDQAQRLESVGQLAAGVAHEINTPMQYIGDNVSYVHKCFENIRPVLDWLPHAIDQLKSMSPDPKSVCELEERMKKAKLKSIVDRVPEALADAQEGIAAVTKIVAAMKEFSHPGSETKMNSDLNHILSTSLTVAKNEYKYVADIETVFDPKLPTVQGFPSELNQVFLNIIVNAAHAIGDQTKQGTNGRGLIKISTSLQGDLIEVRIQDTGGGMPVAVQARIFEPFFTTKVVGKGTGQGLAIAHTIIVQKHLGRIWCDVDPGVGTTFVIQIPREIRDVEIVNGNLSSGATCELTPCVSA